MAKVESSFINHQLYILNLVTVLLKFLEFVKNFYIVLKDFLKIKFISHNLVGNEFKILLIKG